MYDALKALIILKTDLRQAEDIIREVGVIGDAMEDSAFNSMMSINHIGSKSIAEIRQQSIHSFVQLRLGYPSYHHRIFLEFRFLEIARRFES